MVIKKLLSKLPEKMLSKLVLKGILRKSVNVSDEAYQKDFKNFTFKVNWKICDAIGYQIYEQTNITLSSFLNFSVKFWQGFGNWLTQLVKEFPGDNAFFIKREVFDQLNGFSPMWICEDLDLSRRLLKYSKKIERNFFKKISYKNKIAYIRTPVKTSTRRFETYGFFKSVYMWFKIYLLWRAGFSPDQLRDLVPKYKTIPQYTKQPILWF